MTNGPIADLHKRIRQEATGLTRAQVEQREAAALATWNRSGADEDYEIYSEWYGIGFVMQPDGRTWDGMGVYDPALDGRPL